MCAVSTVGLSAHPRAEQGFLRLYCLEQVHTLTTVLTARAWQRRGRQSKCQQATTLVMSSEASDKGTDVLSVLRACSNAVTPDRRRSWSLEQLGGMRTSTPSNGLVGSDKPCTPPQKHTHSPMLHFLHLDVLGFQDKGEL